MLRWGRVGRFVVKFIAVIVLLPPVSSVQAKTKKKELPRSWMLSALPITIVRNKLC